MMMRYHEALVEVLFLGNERFNLDGLLLAAVRDAEYDLQLRRCTFSSTPHTQKQHGQQQHDRIEKYYESSAARAIE